MNSFRATSLPAFTLIETLIAIAVISLAIVGPFHVVQGVLQTSYIARDQLIATALAQEGIEYVREVRDSNFLYNLHNGGSRAWLYTLDGAGGPTNCYSSACAVDPGQLSIVNMSTLSNNCQPLWLSGSNLYNQQCSGTVTKFTRQVQLTSISATETLVTVTVSWNSHGVHSIVLTENLRSWL